MKQKDFIFNIAILLFLNILIKPFWILGVDVAVQNQVGAAAYGLYFAILNFTFLFNVVLDMGITNFNNRNIARHNILVKKHLSGIITLKLLLGIIYLLITFIIAVCIGYDTAHLKLLFWIAINQFLNAFILYLRSNISALFMFKTDSILSILDRLLMIIICSILLWTNCIHSTFKIEYFVYAQTASYTLSAITAWIVVASKTHFQHLHFNRAFCLMILKKSFPFALIYLLMAFYSRIDSVMIERILPAEIATTEAGIYASAFRLLDALVTIAYLFSVILLPLFSKMLKEKENLISILRTAMALLFFFSVTSVTILLWYKIPILQLLYNEHITESAAVFTFIIPCLIPVAGTYIWGTLLTANGNMRFLNLSAIVGIIINLCINFLLIPILHARGAAIASLTTQTVMLCIQSIIAFRILHLPLKAFPWWRYIIFTITFISIVGMSTHYLHCHVLICLIINGVFAFCIALATRLFPLQFWKDLRTNP